MKRLTLIILGVLLCTPLYSDMNTYIAGVPVSGGGCATDTADSSPGLYETYDANMAIPAAYARGQEFQVSESGKLSAIEVYVSYYLAGPEEVTMRWGTSADLTSPDSGSGGYIAEATGSPTETGWYKFTFSTKGDISASTSYYWGVMGDGANGGDTRLGYDDVNGAYSYGVYRSGSGESGWNMASSDNTHDFAFRIYLCD